MIYLECYSDKVLVKTLGIPRKEIHHSYSKGNVCKDLSKNNKSKGLVDEDPANTQPSYIEKLKFLSYEYDIKLLYDEKAQNHLIVLCPRLEDWVLKAAKEAKVSLDDYNLPNDPDNFHKVINIRIENFTHLIEDIKKKKSRMLKNLEDVIKNNG